MLMDSWVILPDSTGILLVEDDVVEKGNVSCVGGELKEEDEEDEDDEEEPAGGGGGGGGGAAAVTATTLAAPIHCLAFLLSKSWL